MLIGALEAGGTKMVCAIGKEDGTILEQVSIPTTTPRLFFLPVIYDCTILRAYAILHIRIALNSCADPHLPLCIQCEIIYLIR